jgi:acyl-CoA hydrolase
MTQPSTPPPPKRPADSATTMTEYVLPTHANVLGNAFGGQILAWIDVCSAICAQRHTGRIAITASIDDLSFERSVKVGQVVRISARVTGAFRTSVEILANVEGEDAMTGERWTCVTAFLTFVAVDASLKPTPVPPLLLESDEDKALAENAAERRARRLERRKETR